VGASILGAVLVEIGERPRSDTESAVDSTGSDRVTCSSARAATFNYTRDDFSSYHCWQSLKRGSLARLRLFGSKAFYDSCCSGDLPPGALCDATRAAYCTTRFSYRFPSSTAYLARYSAADPPGLTSRPTTRSSCTAPCPSCLPLFTGHVFLLDDDVEIPQLTAALPPRTGLTKAGHTTNLAESYSE
jgi:hypothetical protein